MHPLIVLDNFSYAYPVTQTGQPPVWVLDGVDLTIEQGEFVAIMGATGSGKTTLSLALNGIVPHSTGGTIGGNVLVDGFNTTESNVPHLAQTVGIVFQEAETQLFNMTVEAEIAFGLETRGFQPAEIEARIEWALNLVGMTAHRHHSPFELSGGQKQRVAIAALMALKPPVLLLDEPTTNLDPVGKQEVFKTVEALRQQEGMTIIMVSHESEQIAAFADRVVVIADGKVAVEMPPSDLFNQPEPYHTFGLHVPQLSQLSWTLNKTHGTTHQFDRVDAARHALEGLVQLDWVSSAVESEQANVDRHTTPCIELQSVSYRYPSEHLALDDVSLRISAGSFVALLGQNGSGKSTLAKLLNGLLRPTKGRVLFEGKDIGGMSIAQLARSIGFVFQNPDHMIFNATVREELAAGPVNLGLAQTEIEARVEQTLEAFQLVDYADQQPTQLSFGLRRKISIAAAVTMQPSLLILDEPTTGLDQNSVADLMRILHDINAAGGTILLITHDMQLVAEHLADTILLHNGRLLAQAATATLFQDAATLGQTQLIQPPIVRLGQALGMRQAPLSVAQFCKAVTQP